MGEIPFKQHSLTSKSRPKLVNFEQFTSSQTLTVCEFARAKPKTARTALLIGKVAPSFFYLTQTLDFRR